MVQRVPSNGKRSKQCELSLLGKFPRTTVEKGMPRQLFSAWPGSFYLMCCTLPQASPKSASNPPPAQENAKLTHCHSIRSLQHFHLTA